MSYIQHMRSLIGTERLFTVGCGIIVEDEDGRILLQHRSDADIWGIPGGIMEIGESFTDAAVREVYEETGLTILQPELFGLYSGESCYVTYPNGDQMYSVQVIFYSKDYDGILSQHDEESKDHQFFDRSSLPENLNPRQKSFIMDWAEGTTRPVLK
ncbi:NUDIX hydrolase [Pontibacillus marinus]|uniref:UDP-sugar hydrolase n=1 Tax=Pontibacillus marinus BH030004 = DSM 16465 TaxID=1385511 RepID=A0A0A5G1G1_9BACI|nr:NUDIX hydrolase [Pontibacillus marinus]KGX84938.1 UDP-sugar hydrolase [Pontibacillus marinus BH030004 = DSM 16465]